MAAPWRRRFLPLVLLVFLDDLLYSKAQHAWYNFNTESNATNFTSYLRWTQAQPGNVYLATQFYTGCSGGYFGGQIHSDGTHFILFSMWDFNATVQSSQGVSPWCARFGGEGTGSNCGLEYVFEFGLEYRFTLSRLANVNNAVSWSTTVTKIDASGFETHTFLGTILVNGTGLNQDCSVVRPLSVSFQEYYLGGSFYSAANWRGPFLDTDGHSVVGIEAYDANTDCGNITYPSSVLAQVPDGKPGRPNAFFQQGGRTVHKCGKSIWQNSTERFSSDVTIPFEEWPFVRRPTATRPTGTKGDEESGSRSMLV